MGVWKNTALYSIILLVFNDLEIERSIIMTKMKEKLPFIKIIYFDNSTAIDYINIINEGEITVEEINKVMDESDAKIDVEGEAKAKISLLNMLKLSVGLKSNVNLSSSSEKIVNSTLTTNMMVEFIKFAKDDKKIEQIKGVKLSTDKETASYIKSVSPYLALLKDTNEIPEFKDFNIAKFDEVISQAKGYYEFIAKNKDDKEIILRFNVDGFRNNYKFNDLLKMNLTYYGIKVGSCLKDDIKFVNEINQEEKIVTIKDFNDSVDNSNDLLDIYDIILAGVENGQ